MNTRAFILRTTPFHRWQPTVPALPLRTLFRTFLALRYCARRRRYPSFLRSRIYPMAHGPHTHASYSEVDWTGSQPAYASRDSPFCVRIRPMNPHRWCDCTTRVNSRSFRVVYGNPTSDARNCSLTNYVFHSRLDRMMSCSSRVGTDLMGDFFPVRRDLAGNVSQT